MILAGDLVISGYAAPAPPPSAEEEALPTVDDVIANAVAALEELNTWRCKQSIHMDMEVSGPMDSHVTTSMSGKGTIDLANMEMESNITTSTVALGIETETRQIIDKSINKD